MYLLRRTFETLTQASHSFAWHTQPSTTPTTMPLTLAPSASPVQKFTPRPSAAMSISPSSSESDEPSVSRTPHPTVSSSEVPSNVRSESPTGSPLNPTASPLNPTASPLNPTASPNYPSVSPISPSDAPTAHPTLTPETSAPTAVVPVVLLAFGVCPNEYDELSKYTGGDLVSYPLESSWQVFECTGDKCSTSPEPVQTGSGWTLVGTCRDGPEPISESTPAASTSVVS